MESNDFDPGPWKGHDFNSARAAYDTHAGRSYDNARAAGKTRKDLFPGKLVSKASIPLAIISDVTGSMGKDPAIFFSKMPYLDLEGKEYLGQDMEICFGATGDANYSDSYPVQIQPFGSGLELKDRIKKLVIEGGGGGQGMETYEMLALYFARLVETPNAIRKPILIFIGDEAPYPIVSKDQAKDLFGIELEGRLTTKMLFQELTEKWAVYLIRRPYNGAVEKDGEMDASNRKIYNSWATLIGENHITTLPNADRVVDIIFGILGEETDKFDYFQTEVTQRQIKDKDGAKKVAIVFEALKTIHDHDGLDDSVKKLPAPGRSVTRRHTADKPRPGKKLI